MYWLDDGIGTVRDEDSGSSSAGLFHGIRDIGENRTVKVSTAGLLGVGTTNDIGTCAMSVRVRYAIATTR